MIELRWVNKKVSAPDPCVPEWIETVVVRKLQYRQRHIPDSPAIGGPMPKWSDWIDVPEVDDELG